jgi:hypothetical protein
MPRRRRRLASNALVPFQPEKVTQTNPARYQSGRLTLNAGIRQVYNFPIPPGTPEETWRSSLLDSRTLQRMKAEDLMLILPDLSPEVGKAFWDYQRMSNAGFEYKVLKADPGSESEDTPARRVVEDYLEDLNRRYGLDSLIARQYGQLYLRGGIFAELVLGPDRSTAVDLALPDPISVRYEAKVGPQGEYWQLGQYQVGVFVPIDRPTVWYYPIDPLPHGPPYGRPIFSPALFAALFLLAALHDMRRVIAQAGYSQIDFEIVTEVLQKYMPDDVRDDPDKTKAWIAGMMDDLKTYYGQLEPDDALMHTDAIKINRAKGSISLDVQGFGTLADVLERMCVRALKTVPMAMGITDGVSEANSNRQWDMFMAGVKTVQHIAELTWKQVIETMLRAQGIQARVVWEFAENRSSEELRDAQAEKYKTENAITQELAGYITHEEAARKVTNHGPATPEPIMVPQSFIPFGGSPEPDAAKKPVPTDVPAPAVAKEADAPSESERVAIAASAIASAVSAAMRQLPLPTPPTIRERIEKDANGLITGIFEEPVVEEAAHA